MTQEERKQTLQFIDSNAMGEPGQYRYSRRCTMPTLYSSSYAAMTKHLLGDLDGVDVEAWQKYLQSFQQEDGLFQDPVIWDHGWYKGDPLWCGRMHLSCHVLTALTCLGGVAEKEIRFVDQWKDTDKLVKWLSDRDWTGDISCVGNEIMNVGNLLQYSRDFHNDNAAGKAVDTILDWLSENFVSPETGLWGDLDLSNPLHLSNTIQAAYHWWAVFFYDNRAIPYPDRVIEPLLQSQNPLGGFGWGVHNPDDPWQTSACEDIDSLDPLCRLWMSGVTKDLRVEAAIRKGRERVASNRMADGGMVFYQGKEFEYGHPQLYGGLNEGAMFPTWFRTLTLALCDTALGQGEGLQFVKCPGYQFNL